MKYLIFVKITCNYFFLDELSCTDEAIQTSTELNVSADLAVQAVVFSICVRLISELERLTEKMRMSKWDARRSSSAYGRLPMTLFTNSCLYSPPTMHCAAVMSVSAGCPSELHQREASERIGPGAVDRNINLLWNGTERLQFSRLRPSRVWNQPNKFVY